jgi:hypothetical protein
MFVRDNLQKIEVTTGFHFPNPKFLLMFIGVVISPFVLFLTVEQTPATLWQVGSAGSLLTVGFLLLLSTGIGLMMFKNKSHTQASPSISRKLG